jgi:hypothetical protein
MRTIEHAAALARVEDLRRAAERARLLQDAPPPRRRRWQLRLRQRRPISSRYSSVSETEPSAAT